MRKIALTYRIQILAAALILMGASASIAVADDTFALAPSDHDTLVVFGPKGDRLAVLSAPAISTAVTAGSTSFQISYGRDANNYLTAILAPSSAQPQDLHFTVLNKTIDASKNSVVTLTFPDAKHVNVDPGYVGTVSVNSHPLHHRDLVDTPPPSAPTVSTADAPAPAPVQSAPRPTASLQPQDIPSPVKHEAPAPESRPVSEPTSVIRETSSTVTHPTSIPESPTDVADHASGPTQHQQQGYIQPSPLVPPPLLGSLIGQPPLPAPKGVVGAAQPPGKKLYWAEPITPPTGPAPVVGLDQMKLEAVHGTVTVKTPNGDTKSGSNGMLVPSGSSVITSEGSSAAVFLGGVDSARLLPNTEAKVDQKLSGSTRKTDINMRIGTIFARVGHRPGESQDFQVHTPEGVAAARGTSFAVCVTTSNGHEVTICATEDGVVTLTDSSDGHQITVTPLNSGQVSIGSVPGLPTKLLRDLFTAFMIDLQQFNTNMQAIAANPNPTDAERAYYNSNLGFDENTQFYDANAQSLAVLFLSPIDTNLLDRTDSINYVVPATRRALNQQLEPFGNVPLTPF